MIRWKGLKADKINYGAGCIASHDPITLHCPD